MSQECEGLVEVPVIVLSGCRPLAPVPQPYPLATNPATHLRPRASLISESHLYYRTKVTQSFVYMKSGVASVTGPIPQIDRLLVL